MNKRGQIATTAIAILLALLAAGAIISVSPTGIDQTVTVYPGNSTEIVNTITVQDGMLINITNSTCIITDPAYSTTVVSPMTAEGSDVISPYSNCLPFGIDYGYVDVVKLNSTVLGDDINGYNQSQFIIENGLLRFYFSAADSMKIFINETGNFTQLLRLGWVEEFVSNQKWDNRTSAKFIDYNTLQINFTTPDGNLIYNISLHNYQPTVDFSFIWEDINSTYNSSHYPSWYPEAYINLSHPNYTWPQVVRYFDSMVLSGEEDISYANQSASFSDMEIWDSTKQRSNYSLAVSGAGGGLFNIVEPFDNSSYKWQLMHMEYAYIDEINYSLGYAFNAIRDQTQTCIGAGTFNMTCSFTPIREGNHSVDMFMEYYYVNKSDYSNDTETLTKSDWFVVQSETPPGCDTGPTCDSACNWLLGHSCDCDAECDSGYCLSGVCSSPSPPPFIPPVTPPAEPELVDLEIGIPELFVSYINETSSFRVIVDNVGDLDIHNLVLYSVPSHTYLEISPSFYESIGQGSSKTFIVSLNGQRNETIQLIVDSDETDAESFYVDLLFIPEDDEDEIDEEEIIEEVESIKEIYEELIETVSTLEDQGYDVDNLKNELNLIYENLVSIEDELEYGNLLLVQSTIADMIQRINYVSTTIEALPTASFGMIPVHIDIFVTLVSLLFVLSVFYLSKRGRIWKILGVIAIILEISILYCLFENGLFDLTYFMFGLLFGILALIAIPIIRISKIRTTDLTYLGKLKPVYPVDKTKIYSEEPIISPRYDLKIYKERKIISSEGISRRERLKRISRAISSRLKRERTGPVPPIRKRISDLGKLIKDAFLYEGRRKKPPKQGPFLIIFTVFYFSLLIAVTIILTKSAPFVTGMFVTPFVDISPFGEVAYGPDVLYLDRSIAYGDGIVLNNRIPPNTIFNMTISTEIHGISSEFVDFIPIGFEILDSSGGAVERYNDMYNMIIWNISSPFNISYKLRSPNKKDTYYFGKALFGESYEHDTYIVKIIEIENQIKSLIRELENSDGKRFTIYEENITINGWNSVLPDGGEIVNAEVVLDITELYGRAEVEILMTSPEIMKLCELNLNREEVVSCGLPITNTDDIKDLVLKIVTKSGGISIDQIYLSIKNLMPAELVLDEISTSPHQIEVGDYIESVDISVENIGESLAEDVKVEIILQGGENIAEIESCGDIPHHSKCSVSFDNNGYGFSSVSEKFIFVNMSWKRGSISEIVNAFDIIDMRKSVSGDLIPQLTKNDSIVEYKVTLSNPWNSELSEIEVMPDCGIFNCYCSEQMQFGRDSCSIPEISAGGYGDVSFNLEIPESIDNYEAIISSEISYRNPNRARRTVNDIASERLFVNTSLFNQGFEIHVDSKESFGFWEMPSFSVSFRNKDGELLSFDNIEIIVRDIDGREIDVEKTIEMSEFISTISLENPNSLRPGIYSAKIGVEKYGVSYWKELDFEWGLISISSDKDSYSPGEEARIIASVFDSYGNAICDEKVDIELIGPKGTIYYSTEDGSVKKWFLCGIYYIDQVLDIEGEYTAKVVTNTDIERTSSTEFKVNSLSSHSEKSALFSEFEDQGEWKKRFRTNEEPVVIGSGEVEKIGSDWNVEFNIDREDDIIVRGKDLYDRAVSETLITPLFNISAYDTVFGVESYHNSPVSQRLTYKLFNEKNSDSSYIVISTRGDLKWLKTFSKSGDNKIYDEPVLVLETEDFMAEWNGDNEVLNQIKSSIDNSEIEELDQSVLPVSGEKSYVYRIFHPSGTWKYIEYETDNMPSKIIALDPAGGSWWNASWSYRKQINITNNDGSNAVSQHYTINMTINTTELVNAGKLLATCDDLRITFWNGTDEIELDRVNETDCDDDYTEIWFKNQASIAAGGKSTNYTLYYGYSDSGSPPTNKSKIYYLWEDFEDQAHPFSDGTLSPSVTSWSAKNGNYGLSGDGSGGYRRAVVPESLSRGVIIEGWVNSSDVGTNADLPGLELGMVAATERNGYQAILDWRSSTGGSSDMQIREDYQSSSPLATSTANTVAKATWYYIRFIWDESGNLDMYVWNESWSVWGTLSATDSTYTSGYYGVGAYKGGAWDDIKVRLYLSSEPTTSVGDEEILGVEVTLDNPDDYHQDSSQTTTFNCSAISSNDLGNITLYGNWTGAWHLNETKGTSGTSNSTGYIKAIPEGVYEWNCLAYDDNMNSDWGDSNRTLAISLDVPGLVINAPSGTIADTTTLINLSFSEEVDTAWYNLDNGQNITLCTSCSYSNDTYLDIEEGSYILYAFVNNSFGTENGTESSAFTIDMDKNYYDDYDDNSSIRTLDGVEYNTGNVSFENSSWWDNDYEYRKQIKITNNGDTTLSTDYSVNLTINTSQLVQENKLLESCDDLRIVYLNSGSGTEIDRINETNCDEDYTEIWFRLQNDVSGSSYDDNYFVYYNYSSASSPPDNRSKVYLFWDDFDDGNDDGWTEHSGIWSVLDYTYYQSDDQSTYMRSSNGYSNWTDYTIDLDINISSGGTTGGFAGVLFRFQNETDHYAVILDDRDPDSIWIRQWIGDDYNSNDPQEWDDVTINRDVIYDLVIDVYDVDSYDTIRATFNGITHEYNYSTFDDGKIALMMHGTQARYDNIKVKGYSTIDPTVEILSEKGKSSAFSGEFYSTFINTTDTIQSIVNASWSEENTDEGKNITVQISIDGGGEWCNLTNGGYANSTNCPSITSGNSLIYKVVFETNESGRIGILDLNITWTEGVVVIDGEFTTANEWSKTGSCGDNDWLIEDPDDVGTDTEDIANIYTQSDDTYLYLAVEYFANNGDVNTTIWFDNPTYDSSDDYNVTIQSGFAGIKIWNLSTNTPTDYTNDGTQYVGHKTSTNITEFLVPRSAIGSPSTTNIYVTTSSDRGNDTDYLEHDFTSCSGPSNPIPELPFGAVVALLISLLMLNLFKRRNQNIKM